MGFIPPHQMGSLRKGRVSIPGARYFITVCTQERKSGLTDPNIAKKIVDVFRRQHCERDFSLHCATIMPDHLHVLFTLGRTLTLSQTQAKFKSLTKVILLESNIEWQDNYFDHRLRLDTCMEAFARYIYLNPYRKGLLSLTEKWKWWVLSGKYTPEFMEALGADLCPPSQWLTLAPSIEELIHADEDEKVS